MIKKVVLTGGPGSGKTTVIESIKRNFSSKYKVIVVDETASYLINMGIRPFGEGAIPLLDFQELVLKMQLAKEDLVERSLDFLPDENVLLVFDRGLLDNCAYISREEFQEILKRLDTPHTINEFLERYNLIINLVSRQDFYTTENNPARSEVASEAMELGKRTLSAWLGHNNLKIVYPKDDMNEKIKEVLNHINDLLQEREVKSQEKYLIDLETTDMERIKSEAKRANIVQTYLASDSSIEKRLRKTTMDNVTRYAYSVYKILDDGRRLKVSEESLSEKMYNKLLDFKNPKARQIEKIRYYFSYEDEYFQLDIIDGYGILEINIGPDGKVIIPPFVTPLENVTNNPLYYNRNIALKNPKEYVKK